MLTKAAASVRRQPFVIFPPGLAIILTVLALNVLGDGVRDAVGRVETTPRRRRTRQPRVDGVAPPSTSGEPPALEINELTVSFPTGNRQVPVVDGVGLTVRRGEVIGLVGESGCGKTVTALAAIGLIDPPGRIVSGSVRVAGRELVGRRERELGRVRGNTVAMVFQDPSSSLDPTHTIGQQIEESLRVHRGVSRRQATRRAIELLEQVGIAEPQRRSATPAASWSTPSWTGYRAPYRCATESPRSSARCASPSSGQDGRPTQRSLPRSCLA